MKPYYDHAGIAIYSGDAVTCLKEIAANSAHCCITSPPYWGLRDYGADGQIGLEDTPSEYVERLVEVFSEVRRVLRDDGTLWLNLGDTYCNSDKWGGGGANTGKHVKSPDGSVPSWIAVRRKWGALDGIKPKDLVGIPWMVAFALRQDGWYLRSEIIWHKPNPMPESVTDRPTKSHEQIFLFSKSERYYYDAEAIAEPATCERLRGPALHGDLVSTNGNSGLSRAAYLGKHSKADKNAAGRRLLDNVAMKRKEGADHDSPFGDTRNKRSVWTVPTYPFPGAHFATFPPALITPCVLAGAPEGGTVLDPFTGAATTALVAKENGRRFMGTELNAEYCDMAARRLSQDVLDLRAA